MPLTIGATPFSSWRGLEPLLRHLSWDGKEATAEPDAGTSEPRLLLHSRPEWAIAHALDQGETPEQALATWQAEAQTLLAQYKSQRNYTAMVEIRSAAQHPDQLLKWLAQNHSAFKKLARPFPKGKAPSLTQPERPSELNLLLATQMVAQSPELAPLMAQLEACSVPLGDDHYPAPTVDIQGIAGKQGVSNLKEENDLLIQQLLKVQEELEKYHFELKDTKKTYSSTQAELDKAKNSLSTSRKELADLHEKLKQSKAELKEQKLKSRKLWGERDLARIERWAAHNKIEQMEHSLSWRVTVPLRKLASLLSPAARRRRRLTAEVELISDSDLFDPVWYLNKNPDVKRESMSPAEHYILFGGKEGRSPSPDFNAKSYLNKYPDIAQSGQNPLVHYLLHGKAEGRKP